MATSSFFKTFVVTDPKSIKNLLEDAEDPRKVTIRKYDPVKENARAIEIIKSSRKTLTPPVCSSIQHTGIKWNKSGTKAFCGLCGEVLKV